MRSNGFGRWVQSIIVHVDASAEKRASEALAIEPFVVAGDPPRAYFRWHRGGMRKGGDDEAAAFELSSIIGTNGIDWEINWERSVY